MGSYVLRAATADDVPVLVRGRVRMFEDMATHAGTVFDRALADEIGRRSAEVFADGFGIGHGGWIVERDGEVAAVAMVTIQPWLPHPRYPTGRRAYYHSVHTDPAHRGNGLARRLTEQAIAWARTQGFGALVLHASDQGRPIYEKLGFTPTNEWVLPLD